MNFGFMIVILCSDRRHVSATHMAIFTVAGARIQLYLYCVGTSPQLKSYSFSLHSVKW